MCQVDAFTSHPFSGNPAAVCLMDGDQALDETTMQQVAAEMNLSETAYVECAPGADFATARCGALVRQLSLLKA